MTIVYACAKEQFEKGNYKKSMGQYLQGLLMFPFEAKMFSNLIITMKKLGMNETAKMVFQQVVPYMGCVTNKEDTQYILKSTRQVEDIYKKEEENLRILK